MQYRPEIDGLRTLAVIPVVLFHLGYGFVNGGYYGVDVFFVISGFLITRLLTQSIEDGNFSMSDFWIRRIKRLLPALLTVVIATLIAVIVFVFRPVVKETLADVFPAIFSYFNVHALTHFGNYWGAKSNNSFFLHVWSLSVEEQFYILYPFFLFFTFKYLKGFFRPLLVLTVCSLFLFMLFVGKSKEFTFYMLPTRLWELSLGGMVSLIILHRFERPALSTAVATTGLLMILVSYVFGGEILSKAVLLPTIGTAMVLFAATSGNIVGKLLSRQILVTTGKLSYSIYLWHWPVIVLFKNLDYQLHHLNRHLINAIIIAITFLLSFLTYTFIETKTRNYKHTPKIVLASIILICGVTFGLNTNFPVAYESGYNQLTDYFRYYDISPKQAMPEKNNPIDFNMKMPQRPEHFSDAYKKEGIIVRKENKDPEVILFGDSHGVMWAKLIEEISDELNLSRSFYTSTASKPFFDLKNLNSQSRNGYYTELQRTEYAQGFVSNINKWKPGIIIIACRWEGFSETDKIALNDFLDYFGKDSTRILIINQPPRLTFMDNKNAAQFLEYLGFRNTVGFHWVDLYNNESVQKSNHYLNTLEKKHPFVTVYDAFNTLQQNNRVKVIRNRDVLYYDDDHLSYPGTQECKEDLKNILIEHS